MSKVLTQIAFFFFGTRRRILGSIFSACVYLLAFAFFMEYQLGLEPCPMCIVQRIAIALVALLALIAIVHNQGLNWYFGFITFITLGGAASATRHLYLQSLPADQIPTCGPDLAYLIKIFLFWRRFTHALHWRWQLCRSGLESFRNLNTWWGFDSLHTDFIDVGFSV